MSAPYDDSIVRNVHIPYMRCVLYVMYILIHIELIALARTIAACARNVSIFRSLYNIFAFVLRLPFRILIRWGSLIWFVYLHFNGYYYCCWCCAAQRKKKIVDFATIVMLHTLFLISAIYSSCTQHTCVYGINKNIRIGVKERETKTERSNMYITMMRLRPVYIAFNQISNNASEEFCLCDLWLDTYRMYYY